MKICRRRPARPVISSASTAYFAIASPPTARRASKRRAGRYHLYVAYTCPWAHRTQIYLALKKLTGAISVSIAVPGLRTQGWTFEDNPAFPDCIPDRVNGFHYLHQAYAASDPHYTGKVTVPTLWDKKTKRIVNNESSEIIRMLNRSSAALAPIRRIFIQNRCAKRSTASTRRSTPT